MKDYFQCVFIHLHDAHDLEILAGPSVHHLDPAESVKTRKYKHNKSNHLEQRNG
jgi:hypothetical protein